ncbi:hypothetical protein MP638_000085 [Amoeboaphelidium occidentale]|nr:hypothetical protein MP638_000085 [Amoeboaphelidium occidentale]
MGGGSGSGSGGSSLLHHLLPGLTLSNNTLSNTSTDLPDPPVLSTNPTSFVAHIDDTEEQEDGVVEDGVVVVSSGSILFVRGQDVKDLELTTAATATTTTTTTAVTSMGGGGGSGSGSGGSSLLHHLLPGLTLSNNTLSNTSTDLPDPPVLSTNPTSFVAHIDDTEEQEDGVVEDGVVVVTYKNNHSIPSLWLSTMESCKREKEFKFILWTDEQIDEFIKTEYPEFYTKVFIKYPYNIQRVDAFRYFVLYSYGGIYMDLDIGCVDSSSNHHHPLTFLIDGLLPFNYETIFPKTSPFGVSNDLIISTKHSSFLLYLIKNLEYYYYNNEYFLLKFPTVMFSTVRHIVLGPAFVDLNLISYSNNKKDVGILDPKFYSYSNQKFFYHVHGSSWHGIDAKVFHFYHEHTGIAVVLTVMFVIVGLYMVWKCCRNLL